MLLYAKLHVLATTVGTASCCCRARRTKESWRKMWPQPWHLPFRNCATKTQAASQSGCTGSYITLTYHVASATLPPGCQQCVHLVACPAQLYFAHMVFDGHHSALPVGDCKCLCRLWPDPESIKPQVLGVLTASMVSSFTLRQSRVLWVPHHDGVGGQWAAVHEVCLLPEAHPPSSSIVCVARRAGLLIPDAPEHILKVCQHTHK